MKPLVAADARPATPAARFSSADTSREIAKLHLIGRLKPETFGAQSGDLRTSILMLAIHIRCQ